jgi:hypothetical protein
MSLGSGDSMGPPGVARGRVGWGSGGKYGVPRGHIMGGPKRSAICDGEEVATCLRSMARGRAAPAR